MRRLGRVRRVGRPAGEIVPVAIGRLTVPAAGRREPAMTRPDPNPALAAGLTLLASALIAATTLLAKALGTDALGPPMHPFQVAFGRFLFGFLTVTTVAAVMRPALTRPRLRLHLTRTTLGFAGVTLMFAAAARIPLSDATAISFLNPIFCMMLAVPLLGEVVGRWRWTAAALALVGAAVLIRPGVDAFQPAAFLALGAAVALGAELIVIKRLTGRERPIQILWVNNALGVCLAGSLAATVWAAPTPAQWAAMAALGLAMAGAQFCYTNAMARADASFVTPFSYLALVFAALYDGAIFGDWPDGVSLTGAAIILAGAALLAWREGRRGHAGGPPAPVAPSAGGPTAP